MVEPIAEFEALLRGVPSRLEIALAEFSMAGVADCEPLVKLIASFVNDLGKPGLEVYTGDRSINDPELPGYYRPEKQWDIVLLWREQLVGAIELKAQVGPSFGNNINNRMEEALGCAEDMWKAYREGRFGLSPEPFLGYVFLLEDYPCVHLPIAVREPFFPVDPVFRKRIESGAGNYISDSRSGASYRERYEILCRRLRLERLYTSTCLILSAREGGTPMEPAPDVSFVRFMATLLGHVVAFCSAP